MKKNNSKFVIGQLIGHETVENFSKEARKKLFFKKIFSASITAVVVGGFTATMVIAMIRSIDEYIAQPTVQEVIEKWLDEHHGSEEWLQYILENDPEFRRDYKEAQDELTF